MRRGVLSAMGVGLGVALLASASATPAVTSAQEPEEPEHRMARAITLAAGGGAWLGVRIENVDDELVEELGLPGEYGVHVGSVVDESPAAEAGLEEDDVIVAWNGERVESVAQLQRLLRETPAGRTVTLGVVRQGEERSLSVELSDRADRVRNLTTLLSPAREGGAITVRPRMRGMGRFFVSGRGRLGVSVQSLGEQLADYFGVEGGALVAAVSEDSPAARAGLRAGDVIVGVAGEDVDDPGDLIERLREREAGPVTVRVIRDRQERSLTVELEERSRMWNSDAGDFHLWVDDGEEGSAWIGFEGFETPAVELAPFHREGFEMPARAWRFHFDDGEWIDHDDGEWIDAHRIEVRVPRIELPDIDLPAVHIPPIEVPDLEIGVRAHVVTVEV